MLRVNALRRLGESATRTRGSVVSIFERSGVVNSRTQRLDIGIYLRALSTTNGAALDHFNKRHIGPSQEDLAAMLATVGSSSLDEFAKSIVPAEILGTGEELSGVPDPATESEALAELQRIADLNDIKRSMIGQGYYGTKTPSVILRNMIENPNWYTAYTPYQAEISQGRLEMLLNFQTMISDITGLEIATCSLLDEGSAAGEALNMSHGSLRGKRSKFFVSQDCFPQTIACVKTRGESMGVQVVVGNAADLLSADNLEEYSGCLVQYPNALGSMDGDYQDLADKLHAVKAKLCVATDLMACTMAKPPGEFGADIIVGSAQRFGVPMFYGGPHAGFMSAKDELKRLMPGRLIGISVDSQGNRALRMALQTREQFIKREKATSNICTAQALLANVAAAYGLYHGPQGVEEIARGIHGTTRGIAAGAAALGLEPRFASNYFDTLVFDSEHTEAIIAGACEDAGINVNPLQGGKCFGLSVDETTSTAEAHALLQAIAKATGQSDKAAAAVAAFDSSPSDTTCLAQERTSTFMQQPVFSKYHSETEMMRYLASLERKDITLRESMIPLGSCTMKLNAASELIPVSWPQFSNMHPFCPPEQAKGYKVMIDQLNSWLTSLTGFAAVSTQPNSGATGEYAGLLCIKQYHESRGESHRDICLIPNSAHGTNPASAVMCGMKVVGVKNDSNGNVDIEDFQAKVKKHSKNLAALMVTYPSTYGKYEKGVHEMCSLIHEHGGQVYMDGANMNAQLGLTSPGRIGADVCHLNLHKTFAIPHGGGGPGVGSIGVVEHLAPFLPGHIVQPSSGEGKNVVAKTTGQVAAAPFGSAGILPIPWMYIRMMGKQGMIDSSRIAMLNANYIAKRLEDHYTVMFRENNKVAHEFIVNLAHLKKVGLNETDVAKRLSDYCFHSSTTSWPLHFSLMTEPTESESKAECDRFVSAFLAIHNEIQEIVDGKYPQDNNVLTNAPHTAEMIADDNWPYPYSRKKAAFPLPTINNHTKVWASVGRVDNAAGDKNLICSCESVEELESKDL